VAPPLPNSGLSFGARTVESGEKQMIDPGWVLVAIAVLQTLFAMPTFIRELAGMRAGTDSGAVKAAPSGRLVIIMVAVVLLSWGAVAFDYYTRHYIPSPEQVSLLDWGSLAPNTFFMTVNADNLHANQGDKLMLLVRVNISDIDKMTDTRIEKSSLYSITTGNMRLALVSTGRMRLAALQANFVAFYTILLPSGIHADQITDLEDAQHVGGKILAVASQLVIGGPPDAPPTGQSPIH
jgi:hypothetical protein